MNNRVWNYDDREILDLTVLSGVCNIYYGDKISVDHKMIGAYINGPDWMISVIMNMIHWKHNGGKVYKIDYDNIYDPNNLGDVAENVIKLFTDSPTRPKSRSEIMELRETWLTEILK